MTMARLADHVSLTTGYPFKSVSYTGDSDAVRLVRGDNIVQGRLRWDNAARWPKEMDSGLEQYHLEPGDVVLAMDRPWIEAGLKYARIGIDDVPSFLVQRVSRLRAKEALDQGFLFYLIGSRAFTNHVLAMQTGTAVPHISGRQILDFQFQLLSTGEQRAMANVLGALDDKIGQNRRTAQKLEELARAIFRVWFVDFEPVKAKAAGRTSFPSMPQPVFDALPTTLTDSENGSIPKGWKLKPLDQVATFLNGLALQKYPPREDGSDLPRIKIAQLRKGSTDGADQSNNDVPEKYIIRDGDVLFSWSGTLEATFWYGGTGALNQHLFKVTSKKYPNWLCLLWVRQHLPWFRAIAASKATTMGHIKRIHLKQAQVVVPQNEVLAAANSVIGPIYAMHEQTMLESRKLAQMRDYLLPKLLSGEVRVETKDG